MLSNTQFIEIYNYVTKCMMYTVEDYFDNSFWCEIKGRKKRNFLIKHLNRNYIPSIKINISGNNYDPFINSLDTRNFIIDCKYKKNFNKLKYKYSSPEWICLYSFLKGYKRQPLLEYIILSDIYCTYWYVVNVIKGRWIEAEHIINDSEIAIDYLLYTTKNKPNNDIFKEFIFNSYKKQGRRGL